MKIKNKLITLVIYFFKIWICPSTIYRMTKVLQVGGNADLQGSNTCYEQNSLKVDFCCCCCFLGCCYFSYLQLNEPNCCIQQFSVLILYLKPYIARFPEQWSLIMVSLLSSLNSCVSVRVSVCACACVCVSAFSHHYLSI